MINLTLMQAGYCTAPEFITLRGGQRKSVPIPAMFALLEHPRLGPILFDTGYSPRFFAQTQHWPYSLYPKITPVYLDESNTAVARLQSQGLAAKDIRHVIISHFHADHVGGLADFSEAQYIYFDQAYQAVRRRQGLGAVKAGFLPGLLPPDFERRSAPVNITRLSPLPAEYAPFEQGIDLLGDGRVLAVPLPGHAHGQMGLFMHTENLGEVFLAADACWHSRAYRELRPPHPAANLLQADAGAYRQTLHNLHRLHKNNPKLRIIPSHCREMLEGLGAR